MFYPIFRFCLKMPIISKIPKVYLSSYLYQQIQDNKNIVKNERYYKNNNYLL